MFDLLTKRFNDIFQRLRGKGVLSEEDLELALKEIRRALLEADVNFYVVKEVIAQIREKSLGQDVMKSLTPGQQVIKIVNEELIAILGGAAQKLTFQGKPHVIMLVGLQGMGKTTSAAKLSLWCRKNGREALLVAADLKRPAAVEQLRQLSKKENLAFYEAESSERPTSVAEKAVQFAKERQMGAVIIDTAGRLHLDSDMMQELVEIKTRTKPHNILLVVDAMVGQDAVRVAKEFQEAVGIDGIIMTKLDGDSRGGAALSITKITGAPIRFAGMGEKPSDFDLFYPDRIASRILGMGDVLTLIEKASASNEEDNQAAMERLMKNEFNLEDFRQQLRQLKKMGPIKHILKLMPKMPGMPSLDSVGVNDNHLLRVEAIMNSMTVEERKKPEVLDGSRKKRIAEGSGTSAQEINALLKNFYQSKKMLGKMLGKKGKGALSDKPQDFFNMTGF